MTLKVDCDRLGIQSFDTPRPLARVPTEIEGVPRLVIVPSMLPVAFTLNVSFAQLRLACPHAAQAFKDEGHRQSQLMFCEGSVQRRCEDGLR